jgi:hypothetical protein
MLRVRRKKVLFDSIPQVMKARPEDCRYGLSSEAFCPTHVFCTCARFK